jgi:hypothetical protein
MLLLIGGVPFLTILLHNDHSSIEYINSIAKYLIYATLFFTSLIFQPIYWILVILVLGFGIALLPIFLIIWLFVKLIKYCKRRNNLVENLIDV